MFGAHLLLPFVTAMCGAVFGAQLNPAEGFVWGGAIGFGVGWGFLALIWLLFALLKRFAGPE